LTACPAHDAGRPRPLCAREVIGAREVGRRLDDGRHVAPEAHKLVYRDHAILKGIEEIEGKALQGAPQRSQFGLTHGRNRSS
jgi:hypothetical protein